jgi:sialidase-1
MFAFWPIAAAWGEEPESLSRRVTVFRSGHDGYPIFRIPAVVRAANGDLLAFCEARQGGDASTIDLVLKRSSDGGRKWGALQVVQNHRDFRDLFGQDPPPITVGNPAPVVDLLHPEHPGRIWLLFTLENDRVFVIHSDDHGQNWSPRREVTAQVKRPAWGWYATGPGHAIQLRRGPHAGRLVVPADHRLGDSGQDRGPNGAQVIYSDDHGEAWQLGAVDDSYEDGLNANETMAVELADGRLYLNTRDQNGVAPGTRGFAYSVDGGASFVRGATEDYPTFQPASGVLDPPVVQCSLLRVARSADGDRADVILFSGPDDSGPSGPGRSDLRIRYSIDGTRTWRDGRLIHIGPAAYSDMVRLEERRSSVGILFEAGSPGGSPYERLDFAVYAVSDLLRDGE